MEDIEPCIDAVMLARCEGIGPATVRKLIEHFGDASTVLRTSATALRTEGKLTDRTIAALADQALRAQCRRDVDEALRLGGRVLVPGDPEFPRRLLRCTDGPTVLYVVGQPELNASRMVSIVGTRQVSSYGREVCDKLIGELAPYGVTVVSGLAYGVDICAHRAALKFGLPTIGCLAHGIQRIYPTDHTTDARHMIESGGGWVSEFAPGVQPVRTNFPERNRVIAGLSDATIVIESGTKGGSMITAHIAASYHREVFAVPGPVTALTSSGCNALIRSLEAILLSHGAQVARELDWEKGSPVARQLNLMLELTAAQRVVVDRLGSGGPRQVDFLAEDLRAAGFAAAELPAALIQLEMQGLIRQLPGKRYRLVT